MAMSAAILAGGIAWESGGWPEELRCMCAKKVGEIVVPFEALPLAERRELAQRHAEAWTSAARAYEAGLNEQEARKCVVKADAITKSINKTTD